MRTKLVLMAAMTALSFNAKAVSVIWGTHLPLEVATEVTPVGSFSDTYLFGLATESSIFSTTVANDLMNVLGISHGMVSLFSGLPGSGVALGSYAFDGTTGAISYAFGDEGPGAYYYAVTGTGTGLAGGLYALTSVIEAVSPVPEVPTYALLLAGAGVVGFASRRKRIQPGLRSGRS